MKADVNGFPSPISMHLRMYSVVDVNHLRYSTDVTAKMSAISSRRNALLTTGILVIVLSVAMPATYAGNTDPHVTGTGSGTYRGPLIVISCATMGFPANITFTATQKGFTAPWLGMWTISGPPDFTWASGNITNGVASTGSITLTGFETGGHCFGNFNGPTPSIVLSTNCGTPSTITWSSDIGETGTFTGSTHCGFPK